MPGMPKNKTFTGFAIALAWPETYCKQPGSWYDGITRFFNISTNNFYRVGHAALVLINSETNQCHYFDFGRYHSPFQYGRVRGEITDPGLTIKTTAQISGDGNNIDNFRDILEELQSNHECHGDGNLHAAYTPVNFKKAFRQARQMQESSPISYGPFAMGGTNCSRFVCTTILAGQPAKKFAFRLKYLVFMTPTPLNNVDALEHKLVVSKPFDAPVLRPAPFRDKRLLKTTLPQPEKQSDIPGNAQWLSGEGAGSWFFIQKQEDCYTITRYNEAGETECQANFRATSASTFEIDRPFRFTHLSHCQKVTIIQDDKKISFVRTEENDVDNSEVEKKRCYA